jgi:gliding motility-associated-like protein
MKNIYLSTKNKLQFLVVLAFLLGGLVSANAQVRVGFTQRTSSYTPTKKIYNVKGNFTMLGNTCLSPQNYGDNTNNNGQNMLYVDTDGNGNTMNSSMATLTLPMENGGVEACSNIVYAGLYWTGKSSPNTTFSVTKNVVNGSQVINNNLTVVHNQNIANTNYSLSVTRGGSNGDRYPIYTYSGNGNTYAFSFLNNQTVTLSVNGGGSSTLPASINSSGSNRTATLNTPYAITDGSVTLTIKTLTRNSGNNLSTTDTQNGASSTVTVAGTVPTFGSLTKNFDKRVISLKGPNSGSYSTFTAATNDIYYPSGTDDDIYTAYTEVTDYVRTNGVGQYWAADIALLEGNVGGTGYAGGWGMIIVYENSKMKYRDVTIFDGYAYVNSGNTSGNDLAITGFNTVQVGNVGMKLGVMASEGDVDFTGDYFRVRKLGGPDYQTLDHGGTSATNFFNSSINAPGARNPQLLNNTAIDITMTDIPNPGNTVIGNSQTSTNFRYGTDGDTYSIFAIAMAVDAYIPDTDGEIAAVTINGQPAGAGPYNALPGQDLEYKIKIRNRGTEAINNYKVTVPVPYNTTYVAGSATRSITFAPAPTPNTITYNPAVGANGSVIWDLGTLPVPAGGPDTVLGEMTFKFKVTTDCTLLKNTNCNNVVAVNGNISGMGAITGIALINKSLIQGYTNSGNCQGVEIAAPILVNVNAQDYVNTHCQAVPPITAFFICNSGTSIPITEVTGAFPPGSTFWGSYPVVSGQTVQYTINNPFPATLGTSTYYAIPPGVLTGCYFQFTITVTTITTQPTTANVNYCQGATASPLTATPSAPGLTLYYYDSLNGVAQASITPSTATIGQTTYYVSEGQSLTCIGPKKPIVVTVYAIPTVPVLGTVTQPTCSVATGSVALSGLPAGNWTITQTGTANNTYNGTGASFVVPNLAAGTYTFTVAANNCASAATTSVTINAQPSTPVVPVSGGNQTVCEASPIQTLTAAATAGNGESVVWYSAATGGTLVANPTLNTVGTVTYYAQANNPAGCTSPTRVAVTLTINAAPAAPTVNGGNQTVCEASPIQTLTATATAPAGSTVVWYNAATGGSVVANPILNTVGTVTYYAQANATASACSSLTRTAVTLTINPAPTAPTVTTGNITECEQSPIQTLTATGTAPAGSTIVWYNAAVGGSVVANPVLNSVGTVTYYAQANGAANCTSLTRTPVVLTINAAPVIPVSGGNQTVCEANPIQTLTATATAPGGQTIVWYTAAVGGTIVANPILNTVGTVTYYAQANNNTSACSSLTRTPVILTITNAPVTPVSGGDETVCQANPIQTLTATATAPGGATVVWYSAATGGSVVANPILNTVGTVTYYAQAIGGTCSSLNRTPVTLTINAAPAAPTVSAANQTVCEASPIQTLTATATAPAGSTVVWYDAATGGNVIANPILNSVGTVTYYAQANVTASACSSLTRTAATLTINAAPVAPTVTTTNITECAQSPIQTLTATATAPAGATVVWYTAATGGSVVANPILNSVGTVTYYAQANTTATSCSSLSRVAVTLTINATPVAPTVTASNITECEQSPIQTLTATATAPAGQTIVWYNAATGGQVVANPILNAVGTVTYYAQANADASACSSLTRTAVVLTINATPAAPTVSASNITECQQSPIQTLTATATATAGSTVVWYTAATGGTIVANPILNSVGTVTYYAQANTTASSCTSFTRTPVTLTINAAPVAPTVTASNITECEASPIQTLTATATAPAGATVVWYTAAVGGTIVASPTLNTVGTVTYYAQANTSATTCTSLTRTAVTLTINAAPVAPTVTASNITECQQSPIQTLTATATAPADSTVVWYTAAVGGTIVANPILNTVGTVTYYAQANTSATTCTSLTRTAVTLTINAAPVAPTVQASNITECEQSPIQTLTATATAQGATVVWYTAAVGGTIVANPILNTVGTVTYYAQASGETCSSLTRTPVTLTINAAPVAPTVQASNITECEQSPIQTLTATATAPAGATVVWYNALVGGSIVANPTLNTVGTVTYYAQANTTATTCTSLTRTAVTLTITNAPVTPLSGGDQTECEQSPIQTLTATATVAGGQTITWYTAAVGGTVVANPILNTVGTVTYYAQASGGSCSSLTRTPVTLTINAAPVAPTVSAADITECEQSPIQTLTATATVPAGATLVWYDAATGGSVVANPILNTVGTVTYYAQAITNATDCTSLTRTSVTLTINPAAVAPTVQAANITECEQSPIQTLTATATAPAGATVVWYTAAVGGTIVANPILNTVGTVTYYAQANVDATACSSLTRTSVTLTINPAAVAPTVQAANITECEQSPIQTLTATATAPAGATVVWYDAATGGNIVASPTLNTVGTVTYYAQANVDNTACSSLTRTSVTLTINPAAEAPTVEAANITECEQSPIQTLTATATAPAGSTIVWYDAATGGTVVANPILNTVGTVTYYAQANVDNTACSSLTRTSVTLTINPAAEAPTVQAANITECEQSPIQTLTATATAPAGATIVWYDAATGGSIVANPILNTVGTVTYYAQANVDNTACSSLTRTSVTLTINAAPEAPAVQAANITECEESPIQTLTATATAPAGQTIVWYDAAVGGTIVANPILNTVGTVTYYAQANVDASTCSSLTRTAVTLTITNAPEAPISGGDITECEQSPIQTLTSTATVPAGLTIVWYDAATGGTVVANPILNTVGTITYYAEANGGTCTSLTRTAVTLTINPAAEAPTVEAANITECEQSPIQTLTATATAPAGATIVWYDAATGGTVVANPILNTVGTVTYYAQANVDATACSSLTRTAVTLTINPAAEAPTVEAANITECEQSPIQTLTATATAPAGATIVWYDAATGGTVVANPILNTVGTVTYYAQANVDATACSSLTRTAVTLTINPAAEAPTVEAANITECEQSPIQTLTATATAPAGATIVWYDAATGGTVVANPILNTVGTVTYYAQANVDATACSSLTRTAVTLTITTAPEVPVSGGDITECEQSPIQTLTATATVPAGFTVVWYDAATGGTVVANPTLNTVGTVTYYAEANGGTCTSLTRTAVTLTINPAAAAPTVESANITECEQSPIQTLTATATAPVGATVVWYDAATGGTIVANPTLNTVGTVTYYAQANVDATACSSLTRTAVTLTINPAAAAPTVEAANITECEQSPIQTLTATATAPAGATVVWYTAAVGGTVVANPILNTVGTVTYYAQANVDNTACSSLTRTSVTLTINPAAQAPVTGGDITECEQSPIQTLTATATAAAGQTIVWYDAATGGSIIANPTLNTVGTVTYYAQANVDASACSSLTRTAVTLTINAAPAAPITGGDITECALTPIQTLTATATVPAGQTIVWYTAATGGTVVANPTLNTVGTVTYYAEANNGTCSSLTRTAVTLTINAAPVSPSILDATGECSVTVTPPSLSDNCGVQLTAVPNPNVLTYTEQGTYIITWNFQDANGNIIVSATQNVIVDDVTAPAIPNLVNVTGECSAIATPPTTLDNCAGQITGTTSDPLEYNEQGTFIIHWTFNDGNGNSIVVNQTVIVDDITAPAIPVLEPISGQCSVTVPVPSTTDNCSNNPILGTTGDPLQYNTIGDYIVTWSFDDGHGNKVTATQEVHVTAVGALQVASADADCNKDVDVTFNLNSYLVGLGVPAGGTWADTDNTGGLSGTNNATFSPYQVPVGNYVFTYTVQDGDCTRTVELTMTVASICPTLPTGECEPVVHNAMSPNGDGQNDFFQIDNFGDSCITANSVEIYNRWGILVFESNMYDNNTRVFKGYSEGRTTVGNDELPTGTYFYILNWTSQGVEKHKEGYLYLSR